MRTLKFLLQKEFRQIFRDPAIIRIIFVMPSIQLLILPWAADYEIKNIQLAVVDHDHSDYAQKLVSKITASGYFKLDEYTASYTQALHEIEKDHADIILEIPASFEKNLVKEQASDLLIAVNAINGVKAGLGSSYLQTIISDFNHDVRLKWMQMPRFSPETTINVTYSNWFNPLINYKFFMVPGIMVLLISFFLMMIFILLGGLYTPINSMPEWAQWITKFNPVSYFIEVIRMVILKGSNLADVSRQIFTVLGFAAVLNTWAVISYRKRA